MSPPERVETRLAEYWDWVAVGLFLLVTVDLLTTLYAVEAVGLAGEANPLMAWLLTQPLAVVVAVHVAAAALVAVLFYGLFELVRETRPRLRWTMMRWLEVFLGLFVAVGLFVFANNLSVVVLGETLL